MYPGELRYSTEHEWVKQEGNAAVVGISHYAQDALGDVVYVELPKIGAEYKAMEEFGVVESVKTVSTLYSPVSGKIIEVNSELSSTPALVNQDPYGKGWMIKVQMSNPEDLNKLLSAKEYEQQLEG